MSLSSFEKELSTVLYWKAEAERKAAELERAQETIADLLKALKELASVDFHPIHAAKVVRAGQAIERAEDAHASGA